VQLTVRGNVRWSPAVESALFACCTDLLAALEGHVTVTMEAPEEQVAQLTLRFDRLPSDPDWLRQTVERIEVLGGTVEAGPVEAGTAAVRLRLPALDPA